MALSVMYAGMGFMLNAVKSTARKISICLKYYYLEQPWEGRTGRWGVLDADMRGWQALLRPHGEPPWVQF